MTVDREFEIGAAHALAVVGDADQAAAAAIGEHVDAGRAGIERVLDQFLDHARRTLDHLAGGDAIDGGWIKLADGHSRLKWANRASLVACRPVREIHAPISGLPDIGTHQRYRV